MSAIAGLIARASDSSRAQLCEAMLATMGRFGPGGRSVAGLTDATFGRSLHQAVPEDRFDRQPSVTGGRSLFVADCRIDNREELVALLQLPAEQAGSTSDADIAALAWDRWGLGAFNRILGDVAMAAWESQRRVLTLARSAMSLKPLFYALGDEGITFASMPDALFTLPWLHKRLDNVEAAANVAGLPSLGNATMFEGIRMVRHGEAVEVDGSSERLIRFWSPPAEPAPGSLDDYGEALRTELDRSVRAQMRRTGGPVACQLSAGRDSSAVTAAAALHLDGSGEPLIALTGAPSLPVDAPAGRLADESALAGSMTALYPNMTHIVCRSRPRPFATELREASGAHWRPISHLTAHHWTSEIDDEASAGGARILLIGSAGNFSLSPSGPRHLTDLFHEQGAMAWWKAARVAGGGSWSRWRTTAKLSFGPLLPKKAYELMLRSTFGSPSGAGPVPLLREPYRKSAEQLVRAVYDDPRPQRSQRAFSQKLLIDRENADKMSLALSGLDVRDPTADRRLVELGLSIPAEYLVAPSGAPSPVYEKAFAGRVPQAILNSRARGLQGADWFHLFPVEDLRATFRALGTNRLVGELFDLDQIELLLAKWPKDARSAGAVIGANEAQLLNALAVADFVALHFPHG